MLLDNYKNLTSLSLSSLNQFIHTLKAPYEKKKPLFGECELLSYEEISFAIKLHNSPFLFQIDDNNAGVNIVSLQDFEHLFYSLLHSHIAGLIDLSNYQESKLLQLVYVQTKLLTMDLSQFFEDLEIYSKTQNEALKNYINIFLKFKGRGFKEALEKLPPRDDLLYLLIKGGIIDEKENLKTAISSYKPADNIIFKLMKNDPTTISGEFLSDLKEVYKDNLRHFYRIINYKPRDADTIVIRTMKEFGAIKTPEYSLSDRYTYLLAAISCYANYSLVTLNHVFIFPALGASSFSQLYRAYINYFPDTYVWFEKYHHDMYGSLYALSRFFSGALMLFHLLSQVSFFLIQLVFSEPLSQSPFSELLNPIPTIIPTLVLPCLLQTDILYRIAEFTGTEVMYYKVSEFAQSCFDRFLNSGRSFVDLCSSQIKTWQEGIDDSKFEKMLEAAMESAANLY
ncbi:MAG: hypothetical protein K0R73_526 [Candidatus Midichloriaceae bacterium]|jgi:hypothetical protein|nr:hypothetical protein [Candidatus Midichloriaceae bacterium]